jgi:hypothetical protein
MTRLRITQFTLKWPEGRGGMGVSGVYRFRKVAAWGLASLHPGP